MISVISLNFLRSDLAERSAFQFNADELHNIYPLIKRENGLCGAVILSTCNRTEIYLQHDCPLTVYSILKYLQIFKVTEIPLNKFDVVSNTYLAARHIIEVGNGLRSMVLGDKQIIGQFKAAFSVSQQHGLISGEIERIFQAVYRSHKKISNQTVFHRGIRSISYLAVSVIKKEIKDLAMPLLVIGAGEIAADLLKYLSAAKFSNVTLVNRTYEKASLLARQYNFRSAALNVQPEFTRHFRVIISCAAAYHILPVSSPNTDQLLIDLTTYNTFLLPADFKVERLVTLDHFVNLKKLADINQLKDLDQVKLITWEEAEIFFGWVNKRAKLNHQKTSSKAA